LEEEEGVAGRVQWSTVSLRDPHPEGRYDTYWYCTVRGREREGEGEVGRGWRRRSRIGLCTVLVLTQGGQTVNGGSSSSVQYCVLVPGAGENGGVRSDAGLLGCKT